MEEIKRVKIVYGGKLRKIDKTLWQISGRSFNKHMYTSIYYKNINILGENWISKGL